MLTVADIFKDHMVLQRDRFFNVWGTAEPGESIVCGIQGRCKVATADEKGNWKVLFEMLRMSYSEMLSVAGAHEEILLRDIMVGELWATPVPAELPENSDFYEKERRLCDNNYLRVCHIKEAGAPVSYSDWTICRRNTLEAFTPESYRKAESVWNRAMVPVGILQYTSESGAVSAAGDRFNIPGSPKGLPIAGTF